MKNIFITILAKTKCLLAVAVLVMGGSDAFAQTKEVPYTLDDRDRMIRVEEKINSLEIRVEEQIKSVRDDMKILRDDMKSLRDDMNNNINKLYTLIYFVLGGVFGLIGLILWDRRSYIKPVKEDIEAMRTVLRIYAEKNPELKEILNKAAL